MNTNAGGTPDIRRQASSPSIARAIVVPWMMIAFIASAGALGQEGRRDIRRDVQRNSLRNRQPGKVKPRRRTPQRQPRTPSRDPVNEQPGNRPAAPGDESGERELSADLNVDAEDYLLPFDERTYSFSFKDVTYSTLIEAFARMAGLGVIGEGPSGTVSFVTAEEMDFQTALGRLKTLLFKHPEQYWMLLREDQYLEVVRVTEILRILPLDRIFPTLERYRAADLRETDLALLLYTPQQGSIADLEPLRDFMPDYVRIAQYSEKNAITVFGLVRDINKYLDLVGKFQITSDDPRRIELIEVEHILPSEALESLTQLVEDIGPDDPASKRRRRRQQAQNMAEAPDVTVIPQDDLGTLLVQAMPSKIEEIQTYLDYIDVPYEEGFDRPVAVPIEHANAGEVMTLVRSVMGGEETAASSSSAAARRRRRAARRRAARRKRSEDVKAQPIMGQSVETEDLTMIEWAPNNSVLLIGDEEQVAEARSLLQKFDVPPEMNTTIVNVEHHEAETLAPLVVQLVQATSARGPVELQCTPAPLGDALILAGSPGQIERAKAVLADLDVPDASPEERVQTITLVNAQPSALIPILTQWETATESAALPASNARRRLARRRRARQAAQKFQADDPNRKLYVIVDDEEWHDVYKPLIERLDAELARSQAPDLISLVHVSPEEATQSLQAVFGESRGRKRGPAVPSYIPVPNGLLVRDASPSQVEDMKRIVAQLDVDPAETGMEVQRKFVLEHADPETVVAFIEQVFDTADSPAAARRKARRRRRTAQPQGPTMRLATQGDALWVVAPQRDMERIALLIEEMDVPDSQAEMRAYEFEPGANIPALAGTLNRFFPEARTVQAAAANPRARRAAARRRRRTAQSAADQSPMLIVSQPQSRRIIISAEPGEFSRIESTLEMLRQDAIDRPGVVYEFFEVAKGDPAAIAALAEPILRLRLEELVASGEIPEPTNRKRSMLDISVDAAARRIVVAGPETLMPEVQELIDGLDNGDFGEHTVRTVALENVAAEDVTASITQMLGQGGRTQAARRSVRQRRARRNARARRAAAAAKSSAPSASQTPTGVSMVAAPGAGSVVVSGPKDEVDRVVSWIEMLDDGAEAGTVMKVYEPLVADVEELADVIMTVLDSQPAGRSRPKSSPSDPFEEDFFDIGGPRRGTEISLSTNYWANSMIVWASRSKIEEIDELVTLYEEGTVELPEDLPSRMYDLEYADPYDAMWDLQEFIDAMWDADAPTVDYLPYQSTLVVKSKNAEDFEQIGEIIEKYVDLPGEGREQQTRVQAIRGKPVDLVAELLLSRLGDEMDVSVEVDTPESRKTRLLKQLTPPPEK